MSETRHSSRTLRSIGAVLAGLLATVVLSLGVDVVLHATRIYPPWGETMADSLFALATAYRLVFNIAGCYIAARLAPDRPMFHALGLGVIGVVLATAGAVATWNAVPPLGPKWYPVVLIVTALPCAWVGGKLREMQLRKLATS